MSLGKRIKERRLELNLSVEDIAEKLHKNRATIYRYENGDIEHLPHTVLEPLATVLKTTPDFLMGWDNILKTADAIDSLKVLLKDVYDDVVIKDYEDTGSYDVILVKDKIKICLEEIPFETLFKTVCSIIPTCVDMIIENTSKGDYDSIPYVACLSDDEVPALDMYRQLDLNDKAEVRGEMKYMLKNEKYKK